MLTPTHKFVQDAPELWTHVYPEHGGDRPHQEGPEHGDIPHVQHPDGQRGQGVDHQGDQEHKRTRVILKQAPLSEQSILHMIYV